MYYKFPNQFFFSVTSCNDFDFLEDSYRDEEIVVDEKMTVEEHVVGNLPDDITKKGEKINKEFDLDNIQGQTREKDFFPEDDEEEKEVLNCDINEDDSDIRSDESNEFIKESDEDYVKHQLNN